jgi:hypothetical protein
MNANKKKAMLVHEMDNNTYLQALKNCYTISPKAYNLVNNINKPPKSIREQTITVV